jgi:hypothetical protein
MGGILGSEGRRKWRDSQEGCGHGPWLPIEWREYNARMGKGHPNNGTDGVDGTGGQSGDWRSGGWGGEMSHPAEGVGLWGRGVRERAGV